MAVIFAVVGGGAVVGIATTPSSGDSDYSNYSNYDNYSNYSDAVERKQRRMQAKQAEVDEQKNEVNSYKSESVNEYLQSAALKEKSGVMADLSEVREDGDQKIANEVKTKTDRESATIQCEIQEIAATIDTIDKILKEGE